MFSDVVLVDGHPVRSSLTDVRPSLKC